MGGQARLVQVGLVAQGLDVDRQAAVLLDDLSDLVAHDRRLVLASWCCFAVGRDRDFGPEHTTPDSGPRPGPNVSGASSRRVAT